jgi:polyphenol oxidase
VSGLAWDDGPVPVLRWRSAPEGVSVAFTSRQGGASHGPYASLNLGALTADEPGRVAENRHRAVSAAGGDPAQATMAWQVHGREVREVTDEPAGGRFLEPGAEPFPRDCIPVAIARADGRRLAVLHAGWRGLEAGIVEAGAAAVGGEIAAAVGPGAGPCCYEVGDDVAARLQARFGADAVREQRADLWLCARRALEAAGATGVAVAGECSICNPDRYFSHRRDRGVTGRQGVVGVLDA